MPLRGVQPAVRDELLGPFDPLDQRPGVQQPGVQPAGVAAEQLGQCQLGLVPVGVVDQRAVELHEVEAELGQLLETGAAGPGVPGHRGAGPVLSACILQPLHRAGLRHCSTRTRSARNVGHRGPRLEPGGRRPTPEGQAPGSGATGLPCGPGAPRLAARPPPGVAVDHWPVTFG
jgi:hypothetical protein